LTEVFNLRHHRFENLESRIAYPFSLTLASLPFIAELPDVRFDVFTAVGNKTVLRQISPL